MWGRGSCGRFGEVVVDGGKLRPMEKVAVDRGSCGKGGKLGQTVVTQKVSVHTFSSIMTRRTKLLTFAPR